MYYWWHSTPRYADHSDSLCIWDDTQFRLQLFYWENKRTDETSYTRAHIYVYIYVCMYIYVCTYVCCWEKKRAHIHTYLCTYICVCMHDVSPDLLYTYICNIQRYKYPKMNSALFIQHGKYTLKNKFLIQNPVLIPVINNRPIAILYQCL